MTEASFSKASAVSVPPIPPETSGSRLGLVVAGALFIVAGLGALLLAGLMALIVAAPASMAGGGAEPPSWKEVTPSIVMLVGIAVVFVWIGIGSILARRWARALALMIAWIWFLCGILGICAIAMLWCSPQIMGVAVPNAAPAVLLMACMVAMAVISVFAVFFPLVLILFYRRPQVEAFCEARHPEPSWTDVCPLPVLAIALAGATAVPLLPLISMMGFPLPCFGVFLSGPVAVAGWWMLAGWWAYASWGIYRLQLSSWWQMHVLVAIPCLSSTVTIATQGMAKYYEAMHLPPERIEMAMQSPLAGFGWQLTVSLLTVLSWSGYLLWVRKHFQSRPLSP